MDRLIPLFLFSLLPSTQCGDLIDKTCKETPHFNLCVSSLRSNPQSLKADVKGLASIMANITLSNATDTFNSIQGLINQTTEPDIERCLDYCAEIYIQVVQYILPQAMDALAKGEYGFAEYGVSDAGKEIDSCQGKLVSIKSPVSDKNKLVLDLLEVTEAIVKILLKC